MSLLSRHEMILDALRRHNSFVTVEQLCDTLFVSGATIRRDLAALETSGLIRRTRGGAILIEGSGNEEPSTFRESRNVMQKQLIAAMAQPLVRDGMTLFLDASSTVLALARRLGGYSNLRVITNGVKTTLQLCEMSGIKVMCTGGTVRENSNSLVGRGAVDFAAQYNADLAFLSCRGLSIENGASEASEEEFTVKRQFMKNSKKCVLLCDSSKMDADCLCRLAPLTRFEAIFTERRELNELIKKSVSGS